MKKLLLTLTLIFALCVPVCAFENEPICDNAALLSAADAEELSQYISELRDAYDIDIAVYTEGKMSGESAEQTADNIYDSKGYGSGTDADGILLYISADPRNYYITTCGAALDIFYDANLEYIEENVLAYLKENDYSSAVSVYAECVQEILEDPTGENSADDGAPADESAPAEEDPTGENSTDDGAPADESAPAEEDTTAHNMIIILCGLIIPLIIAFVATQIKLSKMHTAVKNDYAANYVKKGSMNIKRSKDIFLYSTVTKREKPKPTESTTHKTASGKKHGGRGGSY